MNNHTSSTFRKGTIKIPSKKNKPVFSKGIIPKYKIHSKHNSLSKDKYNSNIEQKPNLEEIKDTKPNDTKPFDIFSRFNFSPSHRRTLFNFKVDNNPFKQYYFRDTFDNQRQFGNLIANSFLDLKLLNLFAIAPTQSGKTGSMLATIFSFFNHTKLALPWQNIFIFTSHSSTEWKNQTIQRFPPFFANQIFHRNNLKQFVNTIKDKHNLLIIFDESHIGSKFNQTLHSLYTQLNFYDFNHMYNNNIKTIHFTATPESLIRQSIIWGHASTHLHMTVPKQYTSIQSLLSQNRILQCKDICGFDPLSNSVHPSALQNIHEIRNTLFQKFKDKFTYNIIRTPRAHLHQIVIQNFLKVFAHDDVLCISETNIPDLDIFMANQPHKHTFIFIKDKLRCAKTINHTHIAILYDRFVLKPSYSSVFQGLSGRLTGYHHNKHAIVFSFPNILNSQFNINTKYKSFVDIL